MPRVTLRAWLGHAARLRLRSATCASAPLSYRCFDYAQPQVKRLTANVQNLLTQADLDPTQ